MPLPECRAIELSSMEYSVLSWSESSKLAENARVAHGDLPIVWAGGVMSNSIIKNHLSKLGNVYFTEPQYSADNAVGVALICRKKYLNETVNRNDE